ncbi:MAG: hypothetical protein IID46_15900 [Planctomycetes bacterium]|nr:hypothetical protein [Planctomycetota bacterium]
MNWLLVPPAQADPVAHADWIELEAIFSEDGASSHQTLAAQLRISGSTDAPSESEFDPYDSEREQSFVDATGDRSNSIASDAWQEIERRFSHCGDEDGSYPFDVTQASIVLKDDGATSPYVFQVLLSKFGKDAVSGFHPERLFEELSAQAGFHYLGGAANQSEFRLFGSPREDGSTFVSALTRLCSDLGEGNVRQNDPKIRRQKDGKLDVVVWRPFFDRRRSQLIAFGQCATGHKWDEKLRELDPLDFRESWLGSDGFNPWPVRMFFVPHCIPEKEWRTMAIKAGIIFDRCRISELVGSLENALSKKCAEWSAVVIEEFRGKP